MHSPDRRRSLVLLLAVAALLGAGGTTPARAQEAPADPGEGLGIYQLESRGQGVQATYEIEGLLPGGSAVLDLGLPEALTRFRDGTGYGLASLAYPGGLLVNLPSLIEQTGGDASSIPPWPLQAEAFYPAGPVEAGGPQPDGSTQHVTSGPAGVESVASYPRLDAPPAVSIGSITTAARSALEDGKAVSRSRVVASDVVVLGGVLAIDSVVTDLVAVHDGQAGVTSGGTTVSGVRFLGLAASLTDEGLVLAEAPPVVGPGAPLGDVLDPLVPGLNDALSPLQQALQDVLDQAVPQLDEVLATAGIDIDLVSPEEQVASTGAASLVSSGLSITLTYEGREQDALVELIAAIPDELKPSLGPIPNPVSFLAENHIVGLSIAPAAVSSLAGPPFPDFVIDVPDIPPPGDAPSFGDVGSGVASPGFSTPAPDLPASSDGEDGFTAESAANVLSGAVPALAVLLVLVAAPFFGLGSSRLADNVLAPAGAPCPIGLDQPPPPPRSM